MRDFFVDLNFAIATPSHHSTSIGHGFPLANYFHYSEQLKHNTDSGNKAGKEIGHMQLVAEHRKSGGEQQADY